MEDQTQEVLADLLSNPTIQEQGTWNLDTTDFASVIIDLLGAWS